MSPLLAASVKKLKGLIWMLKVHYSGSFSPVSSISLCNNITFILSTSIAYISTKMQGVNKNAQIWDRCTVTNPSDIIDI